MSIYLGEQLVSNVGGANNSSPPIKPSDFLDDTKISADKAYSSSQTEKRLDEVKNTIQTGQDSMVKMWQRSMISAKINDSVNFTTSEDHSLDKLQVQAYKFIEGQTNIVENLNTFSNEEEASFFHSDNAEFSGTIKIKDEFPLPFEEHVLNNIVTVQLKESEEINLSDYVSIESIYI